MDLLTELAILVLAAFVGFEVISKVPNTLHTPLMSATNAIHGIVLLGGLLLIGEAEGFLDELLLVIAIVFGTINVVGGFLVTDRAVTIATPLNVPSSMAEHASQLYARNVASLLELMTGEDGALELNFDDEIIAGACITRGGEIVHEGAKRAAAEETA